MSYSKPGLIIHNDLLLKADAGLDISGFGDLLVMFFQATGWTIQSEVLINWFVKNDCTIKELAEKIEYIKHNY